MSSSTSVGIQNAVAVELVSSAPIESKPEPVVEEASPILPPSRVENDFVKPVETKPRPKKIAVPKRKVDRPLPAHDAPKSEVQPTQQQSTSPDAGDLSARAGLGEFTISASPDYLRNPPPPYPRESRYNQEEGTVLLSLSLDGAGVVQSISLKESSRFTRLDEAALHTVKNWKFKPAKVAGIGVSSSIIVPVKFVLR